MSLFVVLAPDLPTLQVDSTKVDKFVILLSDLIGNRDSETMKIAERVTWRTQEESSEWYQNNDRLNRDYNIQKNITIIAVQ